MTQPIRPGVTSCTIGILFAAILAACGADQPADTGRGGASAPAESVGDGPDSLSGWAVTGGEGPAATLPSHYVEPGEGSGAAAEGGRVESLKECAYINYCNEPGS
jgi:hypothetical protein